MIVENKFLDLIKKIFLVVTLSICILGSNAVLEVCHKYTEESSQNTKTEYEKDVVGSYSSVKLKYTAPQIEKTVKEITKSYTVEELTATKYVNCNANVRKGPGVDYEVIGGLSLNQEVQINGQASTGWYRINYNGEEAFISNVLLQDEPIVILESQPKPQPQVEPQPESQPEPQPQPKQRWEYTEDELVQMVINQIITPDMNGFQKATAVNNYLCSLMSYDDSLTHRSTFDALAYGTGVCQGYANAFWRIMNAAGVQTDYISGYGWDGREWGRHGWNRSLIDGTYYYTDVTWNDCLGENKYLLISLEQMSIDHAERLYNPYRVY